MRYELPRIEMNESLPESNACRLIQNMYLPDRMKRKYRFKYLTMAAKQIVERYYESDFSNMLLALKLIEAEMKDTIGCDDVSWTITFPAPEHSVSPACESPQG